MIINFHKIENYVQKQNLNDLFVFGFLSINWSSLEKILEKNLRLLHSFEQKISLERSRVNCYQRCDVKPITQMSFGATREERGKCEQAFKKGSKGCLGIYRPLYVTSILIILVETIRRTTAS